MNVPKIYVGILFFDSEITKYFDWVKILVSRWQKVLLNKRRHKGKLCKNL